MSSANAYFMTQGGEDKQKKTVTANKFSLRPSIFWNKEMRRVNYISIKLRAQGEVRTGRCLEP